MRRLFLAATAMSLIGGGAAFAASQTNDTPVTSTTTTTGVTVGNGLQSKTQAVGNVISVSPPTIYYNAGAGDTQTVGSNSITATSSVENSQVSGVSSVSTLSEGNDAEINPTNTISFAGNAPSLTQVNGPGGSISATTRIGNSAADSFTGDTTVDAAAVGNNALLSSQSGAVGFWSSQGNNDPEHATVVFENTNVAGGALTSEAQAVGNSVSASGIISAGSAIQQENLYNGQTATETLSTDNLLSSGNNVVASAEGNTASIGQATSFAATQDNGASAETATLNLSNATVNGSFSAQAAGNVLSFDSDNGSTVVDQNDRADSTSQMNVSGPVDLNAATTFGSLAVGNQFSGTLPPDVTGNPIQSNSGAIAANSSISGVTGQGFAATVNTTATANLATLTSPGAFAQSSTGVGPTAVASISNSTFSGGLTVSTAAIGNSISIK